MAMSSPAIVFAGHSGDISKPAILGGSPVRTKGWYDWPVWDIEQDEAAVINVLRSGIWCRVEEGGHVVSEFEDKWAGLIGSKRCLAMVNGTNSLITSLNMLNVGAGDEVIVTPYTFIATINAILEVGAMPVFADIDPETFQIDPAKIQEKITSRTRAILPVHILGLPCDIVRIVEIARRHDLVVVEDACQAWLAEVNHQKAGTFGNAGCFSFQNSKNLAIGEGGAIVSDDDAFMNRCGSYSDNGRPYGSADLVGGGYVRRGSNLRMTEYQAAIGLVQLKRLDEQTTTRNRNAAYLRSKVSNIPGILPYRLYDNVTRAAFHLFPFRYKKEEFSGLHRNDFIKALLAEGVPASPGYPGNLNSMEYLNEAFQSKNFQMVYSKEMLDFDQFVDNNRTPENEHLCNEEAVWFYQSMLLGTNSDMDDIFNAIEKVHANAGKIKAAL